MDQKYEKFISSQQARVRLDLALEEYFRPDIPEEHRQAYGRYLRQRIRPAVEQLILREDLDRLDLLQALGWIPDFHSFLPVAVENNCMEALAWLVQKQQAASDFCKPDFSL